MSDPNKYKQVYLDLGMSFPSPSFTTNTLEPQVIHSDVSSNDGTDSGSIILELPSSPLTQEETNTENTLSLVEQEVNYEPHSPMETVVLQEVSPIVTTTEKKDLPSKSSSISSSEEATSSKEVVELQPLVDKNKATQRKKEKVHISTSLTVRPIIRRRVNVVSNMRKEEKIPRHPDSPPKVQIASRLKRHRQVYHHNDGIAVLAIGQTGYTLSNGVLSCCEDNAEKWEEYLVYDLNNAFDKVKRLFTVDRVSSTQWRSLRSRLKPEETRLRRLIDVPMKPSQRLLGICHFCQDSKCHRWKAIVGGVQRLVQFPVDTICH